ncbi:cathepsin e [Plakobranchus ocellatus]|uniref:Cathepsin e n=1 Tax=Plakobranchus ocellatus TaxID=259542 RepID=A0AAV4BP87_9GAST|nr:cathepsin e [Plakobranchus ocellatus]
MWGGITTDPRTPLVHIPAALNGANCVATNLQPHVTPFMQNHPRYNLQTPRRISRQLMHCDTLITGFLDMHYGKSNVGTPGQEFNVVYDNGPALMWILSSRSPSHFNLHSVSLAGLTIVNQTFGEAAANLDVFEDTVIDGIVGLGFRNMSRDKETNLLDNMVGQGLLRTPVFSIYISRLGRGDRPSYLTLGGANPVFFTGDFTFVDLTVPQRLHGGIGEKKPHIRTDTLIYSIQ